MQRVDGSTAARITRDVLLLEPNQTEAMKEYDTYGRRGSIAATWCALAGVAMAVGLAAPLGLFDAIVLPYASSFATALTILFVAAWTLGDLAGRAVFAKGWRGIWTGWFLALTCLTLAVFAGGLVTLLGAHDPAFSGWSEAVFDYIYKPLFWVTVVGLFPIVWLAWLFAKLLARDGAPVEPARDPDSICGTVLMMIILAFHLIVGLFYLASLGS